MMSLILRYSMTLALTLATFTLLVQADTRGNGYANDEIEENRARSSRDLDHREEKDHDQARDLRLQGEIRPLAEILVQANTAGLKKVIETELEQKKGKWVYEIKGLSAQNQMIELIIDAVSGEVIAQKSKRSSARDD